MEDKACEQDFFEFSVDESTNEKHGTHDFGAVEVLALIGGNYTAVAAFEVKELGHDDCV